MEVGRSDLVAKYVGWTAKTVQEKFKAAMGGVLFIDEAYALADDRGGSFGDGKRIFLYILSQCPLACADCCHSVHIAVLDLIGERSDDFLFSLEKIGTG